jgi:serine/threonine protein phosphatase PrpC
MLCSDGLTDVISDEACMGFVQAYRKGKFPFEELPRRLGKHALDWCATDNVTVLCCEYQPARWPQKESFTRTVVSGYHQGLAKALYQTQEV